MSKEPTPEKIVSLSCGVKLKNDKVNEEWVKECNKFIDKNLHEELRRSKGLLLPDNNFYSLGKDGDDLMFMATKIIHWLGLEVERNELEIYFSNEIDPPGLFYQPEGVNVILINAKHKKDVFAVGAILAHEIMHFYLIANKKIRMESTLENELLTDLCTIKFGLGILVVNGMHYSNEWFLTALALCGGWFLWRSQTLAFGYYNPRQYGKVLNEIYIKPKGLQLSDFGGYIKPSSRIFLPYRFWKFWNITNKSDQIFELEKKNFRSNLIKIPLIIILLSAFLWGQYRDHQNQQAVELNNKVNADETLDENVRGQNFLEAANMSFDEEGKKTLFMNAAVAFEDAENSTEAIKAFEKVVYFSQLQSDRYNEYLASARIEILRENFTLAETYFKKLYDVAPMNADINSRLAFFYLQHTDDPKKGLEFATRANTLADNKETQFDLTMAYFINKDCKQGLPLFLKINNITVGISNYYAGMCYLDKKDYKNARKYLTLSAETGFTIGDDPSAEKFLSSNKGK